MALKTDYKDDILDVSQNTKRKYTMIENQDGTVSFDDETVYSQEGDSFGASDINAITEAVNSNSGMPVGTIATFDGTTLPSGFEPYQTEEQRAIAQINDNLTELETDFTSFWGTSILAEGTIAIDDYTKYKYVNLVYKFNNALYTTSKIPTDYITTGSILKSIADSSHYAFVTFNSTTQITAQLSSGTGYFWLSNT